MEKDSTDHSDRHPDSLALRRLAVEEGVEQPGNLPYLLIPDSAQTAVLLVHGFTASPWEMRLLAERLNSMGYAVLGVRLPGHGTTPEDLAKRCWEEWYAAVKQGHQILAKEFQYVFAAGMSTGSLLIVALALEVPLQGLILFSPYLRIQHRLAQHAGWLKHLRPYHTAEAKVLKEDPHYYGRRPVAGVHQINRLIRRLRPRLQECKSPVLAFNGENDRTVVIESGRELVEALGSTVKIYQRVGPDVPHILTREWNPCLNEMFDMSLHFISGMEGLVGSGKSSSDKALRSPAGSVPQGQNCRSHNRPA